MIRLILLIIGIVMLALMGLNVLLEIDVISRHPFEWLAGGLALCWVSTLPWPGGYPSR